ncbi:alpha/beta fold hydrolase [Lysobacter sp. KIS68-7]|uniref:alpha/beta hydrolase family protein n=1 Tax=Lysobacter sp. KIS68-7 TaxID=2904252 RepID=UPI001E2F041D|nr:alpha/beta fold hydrolase [Lysobacter sp. KIS68-7]UHQ18619.1 alpha/beta fold hydrolase [Lysobacter sp. KIS68-7]
MSLRALDVPVVAHDGHRTVLQARIPETPHATLLWLGGMGIAARHCIPFAEAVAARGIAVFVHDWRGLGSSSVRASRAQDWGYRELLMLDLPACEAAVAETLPSLPRIVGGHSLGGQLASVRLGLAPDSAQALWLVASGTPDWRAFPSPTRWWLPMAYRLLDGIAVACGRLPGRRIGFGGEESRGVMRDWSRTGLTGRYAAKGLDIDLEAALRQVRVPIRAVRMAHDWLAPASSLQALLAKMPEVMPRVTALDQAAPGVRADHYAWMKQPEATVEALLAE